MVSLLTTMYPIDADMFYHRVDIQCPPGGNRSLRGYFYILLSYIRQKEGPQREGRALGGVKVKLGCYFFNKNPLISMP